MRRFSWTSKSFSFVKEDARSKEVDERNVRGSLYCGPGESSSCRWREPTFGREDFEENPLTGPEILCSIKLSNLLSLKVWKPNVSNNIKAMRNTSRHVNNLSKHQKTQTSCHPALLSAFESPHHHQRILAARQEAGNSMIRSNINVELI